MSLIECAGDSHYRRLEGDDACAIGIVENQALERLLFDRNLVGGPFLAAVESAVHAMLAHAGPTLRASSSVAELVVLSKGTVYQLGQVYRRLLGDALDVNFVATRRTSVDASSIEIEVSYTSLNAPAECLLIGDTIASGRTLSRALERCLPRLAPRRVVIVSLAGSLAGSREIVAFCRRAGVDCQIILGLAAFGLADNGFDLSFLHEATLCRDDYRARAAALFAGKPVSCVGWDFGSQALCRRKYEILCWMEAHYWGLEYAPCFAHQRAPAPPDLALVAGELSACRRRFPDAESMLHEAAMSAGKLG